MSRDPTLDQRLRREAQEWTGEPPADLAARVLASLPEQRATDAPSRPVAASGGSDADLLARRVAAALLPLAAAALVWLVTQVTCLSGPARAPTAPREAGPPVLAERATTASPILRQVVEEPLLEEWRRVRAEAEGTARYLARQVARPLRGLGLDEVFGS